MNGSPASSTPTVTREASKTESPDLLRDSSLLHSDESAIVVQTHQQHSETEIEIISEREMADKVETGYKGSEQRLEQEGEEERTLLRGLSADRIRQLETRRRGEADNIMDETPIGARADEVITPLSQKSKAKGEKKKKGTSKRTPETVRDTPRNFTLRSADKKKGEEEDVDSEKDSKDEEEGTEDKWEDEVKIKIVTENNSKERETKTQIAMVTTRWENPEGE